MSIRHDISGLERVGRIGAASLGITSLSAARTTRQERQLPGIVPGTRLSPGQYGEAVRRADLRSRRIDRTEGAGDTFHHGLERW